MVTPSPSSLPVALPVRPPAKPSHPLHVFAVRTFVPRAIACTPLSRSRTVSTPIRASFVRCQHANPRVVRALSPRCFLRRPHASLNRFGGWCHHSAGQHRRCYHTITTGYPIVLTLPAYLHVGATLKECNITLLKVNLPILIQHVWSPTHDGSRLVPVCIVQHLPFLPWLRGKVNQTLLFKRMA